VPSKIRRFNLGAEARIGVAPYMARTSRVAARREARTARMKRARLLEASASAMT